MHYITKLSILLLHSPNSQRGEHISKHIQNVDALDMYPSKLLNNCLLQTDEFVMYSFMSFSSFAQADYH